MDGQDFIRMVFSRLPSSCLPWFLIQQLVRVVPNPTYATNTYSFAAAASNAAFPPRAWASTSSSEMRDDRSSRPQFEMVRELQHMTNIRIPQ
jgi:hypothetical protein